MREHGVDPGPYLTDVHDIDFHVLQPDPALAARIAALPGRAIVYTNGCAPYAERVLAARGLAGLFDAVYGVEHAGFRPKPERAAFETVFAADGLTPPAPRCSRMTPATSPRPMRWACAPSMSRPSREPAPHIHHHTDDLAEFLARLAWSAALRHIAPLAPRRSAISASHGTIRRRR